MGKFGGGLLQQIDPHNSIGGPEQRLRFGVIHASLKELESALNCAPVNRSKLVEIRTWVLLNGNCLGISFDSAAASLGSNLVDSLRDRFLNLTKPARLRIHDGKRPPYRIKLIRR